MFENVRIILVEPQHPGNIGASARAMKNMGFNDLRLVSPKRFPDPQADWRAAGAIGLLEDSDIYSTLNKAIADCQLVVGTSARVRNIPRPSIFAKEAVPSFEVTIFLNIGKIFSETFLFKILFSFLLSSFLINVG